ncbi:MAG TPA: flagellar filament capping protein FliD [Bacillales bacterium]|nr:flagellar filament capping protein FliD [Bacillales bacterium]
MDNLLRISGLVSGIDVDKIVDKLMKAERFPLNRMKQRQQLLEWQRSDYRAMNTLLLDLKTSAFQLGLEATFNVKNAVSSDESKLAVTADASAGNTSYTMTNATMATAANNSSTSSIGDASFDPSKSLWSMQGHFTNGLTFTQQSVTGEQIAVSADGTSFSLDHGAVTAGSATISVTDSSGTTTAYTVYTDQASYDADTSTNKVLIDQETGNMTFGTTITAGSTISADYQYNEVAFSLTTYDDAGQAVTQSYTFDGSKSLNDIMNAVNQSDAGVNMFYDSATGKVAVSRSETGNYNTAGKEILFNGSFLTTTLALNSANEQGGTDATFTLNGLTTKRHSNEFTISGVTFQLKSNIAAGETVTVNTSTDTETIFESIKSFVDKYNETIEKINSELSEERYRDFQPLTDEQKKEMSDDDIENWEEKAKSGMLRNDSILTSGLSEMRLDLYSPVSGAANSAYDQLSEIGITTSTNYKDHGKLIIDENKLKAAIADDPNAVKELFTVDTGSFDTSGLATRIEKTVEETIDRVEQKAGNAAMTYSQYFLGRKINDLDGKIDRFLDHLNDVEDRYYREFTAMEKAIQRANQQSAFLMNQFS